MTSPYIDPRIKLRHIACLLEMVRQGGMVPAARELGLSQPAVSKSIAELEEILAAALFDRSGRRMVLTREGEIFARHALAASAALRKGVETLAQERAGQSVVRLGALPTVEVEVVPRAVALFARGPLACRVHVESGPSAHLLALLREGRLDFIVGRLASPDVMGGLVFEQLFSEQLTFAVRPSHPLAGRKSLSLREIAAYPLLLPPQNAIIRPIVDALLIAGGVGAIAQEIETVSNSFARAYALENDAIWTISRSVVARDLSTGELAALTLDTSASQGPVGITMRAGDALSLAAQAMLDAVRQIVADREAVSLKRP